MGDDMETVIPSADEVYEEEFTSLNKEMTYEYQVERVLEEIKKIKKGNSTVSIVIKALPVPKLLETLQERGYTVKFDTCYNSTQLDKYMTKMRITNPKFKTGDQSFMDKLEEQMKGCAFAETNIQLGDDAKKLMESFMGVFK